MGQRARIGIDVGGTFTKAVVLDDDTHEIVAQAVVPTTHTAAEGVAAGVIEAFRRSPPRARGAPAPRGLLPPTPPQAPHPPPPGGPGPARAGGMGPRRRADRRG